MAKPRWIERALLPAILLVALALRLHQIGFGLPSMYDPDEPMFMLKAVELLSHRTLNPHWFGHPGTTTLYLIALTDLLVIAGGKLAGAWHGIADFTQAVYADPALLFIPVRTIMALIAVGVVWLTYIVGRLLHGRAVGLVAAAMLAINGLHVSWSQVVRTDIHASLFMLAALIFAIRIMQNGRLRDYLLAGLLTGFAIATKWPAAAAFTAVIGAAVGRGLASGNWRAEARGLIAAGCAVVAGMFIASPYLFLDWHQVVSDLTGEARPAHLEHTGNGFFGNLDWYLGQQVAASIGWLGLAMAGVGAVLAAKLSRAARWTLLPLTAMFFAMISAQHLIWARWVLPGLPMMCVLAALTMVGLARQLTRGGSRRGRGLAIVGVVTLGLIPSVVFAVGQKRERAVDTRRLAADWAIAHIPPGSTVAVEHLELRLRGQRWKFLFPIGDAGCIDGVKLLHGGVDSDQVQKNRRGSPIVDLGNVAPDRLDSCRADYAILTYFDAYRAEAERFPLQNQTYARLLAGGRTVALYRPIPGRIGGRVVRIVEMPHAKPTQL